VPKFIAPRDVVALAFAGEDADSVWVGKVFRMFTVIHYEPKGKHGNKGKIRTRRSEVTASIELGSPLFDKLELHLNWFTPTQQDPSRFTFNDEATASEKTENFMTTAYMGHADMRHDADTNSFFLADPSQMDRFLEDSASAQPHTELPTRSIVEVQRDQKRRADLQRRQWEDASATTVSRGAGKRQATKKH